MTDLDSEDNIFESSIVVGRTKCELCGKKLKVPETDITKCATCDKCIKGQYK